MHVSVLLKEVLVHLDPKSNQHFIDCTVGEGGHAFEILKLNGPEGKVLGIDRDPEQVKRLEAKITDKRLILACGNFNNLNVIAEQYGFAKAHGVLFDLGLSSWHLEESGRGFTFKNNEPLDMRYSGREDLTAQTILGSYSSDDLEKILKEYGQERFAGAIAKEIIRERSQNTIKNVFQLVEIIKRATPHWYHRQRIHPATRTFQALRIAVNDELSGFKEALCQAAELLEVGGKIVVISFHSLEDKLAKDFFKTQAQSKKLSVLTKKPVVPSNEERKNNPRSRSAKLRAAIKI